MSDDVARILSGFPPFTTNSRNCRAAALRRRAAEILQTQARRCSTSGALATRREEKRAQEAREAAAVAVQRAQRHRAAVAECNVRRNSLRLEWKEAEELRQRDEAATRLQNQARRRDAAAKAEQRRLDKVNEGGRRASALPRRRRECASMFVR